MLGDPCGPRPGELPDERVEIEATGLFDVVHVRQYDSEVVYDAEAYIDLLETFSGYISMEPLAARAAVCRDQAAGWRRGQRGSVHRHWGAVLHVARRVTARPGG